MALKYVESSGNLNGIPARDLTDDEVQTIQETKSITEKDLIKSGCYRRAKASTKSNANAEPTGGEE